VSRDGKRLAAALAVAGATLLLYAPVRHDDFVDFDDDIYVSENPHLKHGLGAEGLRWAFLPYETNWIPLTWLSLEVDHAIFGLAPGGYHATNAVLHAASAGLLAWALAGATGALGASAFVAGAFAFHPLHVESVAWIAERKDVLSGLFFALSLGAWVGYARRPGMARYAAVLACFAASLLAKAAAVTLPLLLLLLDLWPLGRLGGPGRIEGPRLRRALVEKLPLLALAAAVSAVTYAVQQQRGAMSTLEQVPLWPRAANALVSYVAYLGQTLWPRDLAVFYPHPMAAGPAWRWGGAALFLAAATAAALATWRRRPWLAVGWLWYVGMLVPMIGLVQVGMQARADRYMYLPQIGLSIALAFEVRDRVAGRRALRVGAASAALLALAALAIAARIQLATWRNTETLFQHARAATGENFLAEHALGESRLKRGDADGALPYLAEALRLHPHGAVRGTLADALARQGKLDEAIWNDAEAVRDWPESADLRMRYGQILARRGWVDEALRQYAAALALDARNDRGERAARIQLLMAEAWTARKRADRAIDAYEKALALDPDLVEARAGLALARLDATDPHQAADSLEAALASGLDQPAVHFGLAEALDRLGRQAEAIEHYRVALGEKPDSVEGANNLAWLLATARDPALRSPGEALAWAETAARASGRSDPRVLDTLAVSLAAAGRFEEAVAELDAALALLGDSAPRGQLDALRARREQFAARKPWETRAPGD